MLKIGEFARISQVSIKRLRHYDAIGLLRPAQTDPATGYRLYAIEQMADVMRISALRDCGLSLDEIAQLLRTHDAQALERVLRQKVIAQQQLVAEEQARLQRLLGRLEQLDDAARAPRYDIAIKRSEPLTLLGMRRCVASTQAIGPFAEHVLQRCEQLAIVPLGPHIHLYYETIAPDDGFDLFIGMPVAALPAQIGELSCERLRAGDAVACALYRGDYGGISSAYIALDRWLASSGYQQIGPCREIYHHNPLHTSDPASYLTEIQYPISASNESS